MSRLNLFLLTVLVFALLLLLLLRVDHSRPNYQVILANDMTYSPAYSAYAPNPNFADGRTFQRPVPGTLARGEQRFDFAATPQDAVRAGNELANPYPANSPERKTAVERGAAHFQVMCAPCHGGDGQGNGPVAKRGFPPPPSLVTGKSRDMKDGQIFHILTYGQNSMPSFVGQLNPGHRWELVNYLRSLQEAAPASPSAGPSDGQGGDKTGTASEASPPAPAALPAQPAATEKK
ncbi:MAG: cytochrome c [Pirellulales bacterium]|nr:cytochrome c [Pirellulales bacterium]